MIQRNNRLQNNFQWSSSRESTFYECQKKYWYTYYGAWDGWPIYYNDPRGNSLDPLAAYLYMLKNMQSLPIFIGSVVHSVIETLLKELQGKREKSLPPLSTLLENGREKLKKGVIQSLEGGWRKQPKKHTHLLEHYYHLPLEESMIDTALTKVETCLTNWYHSPSVQNIIMNPRSSWKEIEKAMSFEVEEGVRAIVVFDFYLTWQRKDIEEKPITLIFDWKTGQESQKIEDQMYAYALAAQKELKIPIESLLVVPFYLAQGATAYTKIGCGQKETLKEEKLLQIQKKIVLSSQQMIALHQVEQDASGASLSPNPTLFSYTDNQSHCRRCPFQEICNKADYQPLPREELRKKIGV